MTKKELRQYTFRMMGVHPDWKGPVLAPSEMRGVGRDNDTYFYVHLGMKAQLFLNSKRKKKPTK